MSHIGNVAPHNLEYEAIDQDVNVPEPLSPSFPKPASAPLPPLLPQPISTSPPPLPPSYPPPIQLMQAGQPKHNYWLPAHYEDINSKPLPPLEEQDKELTAVLLQLHLTVHNQLQTATNSFGLL